MDQSKTNGRLPSQKTREYEQGRRDPSQEAQKQSQAGRKRLSQSTHPSLQVDQRQLSQTGQEYKVSPDPSLRCVEGFVGIQ